MLCIDELSSDERLTADHCAQTTIAIHDLSSGQTTTIQPPADVSGFQVMGSARFNPEATRVAYALAKRNPDAEQGWVAVSDGLSGASKLIATSKPGEYFTVVAWVNPGTLLLQSNAVQCNPACTSAVWTVGIDGSGLTKITDGTFLTLVNG
jgi:tricorn protease-like protein